VRLTAIGEVTPDAGELTAIDASGAETPLAPSGWDHFAHV
jgi:hypothetical protein